MTPQELKNSILQLAIQGKLVEQRAEEGTAEELFVKIQEEKQRLIAEKKIKKEKPLPEITEEEKPFDIPESWKWCRLNDLSDACEVPFADGPFGSNLKSEHYTNKREVRIIQLSNIGEVGWKDSNKKYTTFEHLKTIQRSETSAGDIVIAKMMPAGRAIIVPNIEEKFVLSSDAVKFVPSNFLEKMYLYYAINSSVFRNQVYSEVQGITRVRTSLQKVKKYILPLPPLAEQKRIVAKIEELLPYIDRYEQAWSKLEQFNIRFPEDMKKSLLQYAIQGKLVEQRAEEGTAEELFAKIQEEKQRLIAEKKIKKEKPLPEITDEEKPFDIPESWKWVRWGDLSQSIQYGYNAPAQESGRIKMIRISDIQGGKVLWDLVPYCEIKEDDISTYLLGANDILFARTGGTVGKSYLVKEVPEEAIYAGYLIRTRYSSLLCPEYLKYFMESQLYWEQLRNGTIATAQPNCNGKTLSKMILPLPPLAEQKRIVEKLEQLLPLCERLK